LAVSSELVSLQESGNKMLAAILQVAPIVNEVLVVLDTPGDMAVVRMVQKLIDVSLLVDAVSSKAPKLAFQGAVLLYRLVHIAVVGPDWFVVEMAEMRKNVAMLLSRLVQHAVVVVPDWFAVAY